MNGRELAQIAFEGYGDHAGWTTYDGKPIPQWDEVGEEVQDRWVAALRAVSEKFKSGLDERELAKAEHAIDYSKKHSKSGSPGHSEFLFLAKALSWLGW